ncbi:MAG: nitronate monooxygenase [Bdellovibrionales bacterium]|nr:nitronate monooxygenase [Bdellovibrionales bacterium]
MGVDISTAELALAVCAEGGIGHISDAMGPYVSDKLFGTRFQSAKQKQFRQHANSLDKSEVQWDYERTYQGTFNHVKAAMEAKRGPGAVFVNTMEKLTMGNPQETLRARLVAQLDAGIDGITLSAGLHKGSLALIADQPRFHDVKIGIIVSSARALKIFLRSGDKFDRKPDYVVVEGPLAGGHLGFGLDWEKYDLKTIVREVMDFLKQEQLDIPVIPAGGVFTGSDAVAFLEQGAGAVQVATRFTIAQECGLPKLVKQIYLRSNEEDIVVNTSSPTGYPMRMLKNSPSLRSNVKPNCEALGYILDRQGKCAYHEAWDQAPIGPDGKKQAVESKMCICYHFMKYDCYTCGHNVYRLKDTTVRLPGGDYHLPSAAHIFNDYRYSIDHELAQPVVPEVERTGSNSAENGSTAHSKGERQAAPHSSLLIGA